MNVRIQIDYIIPGNDDSVRAIRLYVDAVASAIEEAKASVTARGGENAEKALEEAVVADEPAAEAAESGDAE